MAKINTQIQDIDSALTYEQSSFTFLPKIAAPFTTVVNRAQVTNFAADGLPKFGVDRKNIQAIQEVFGEQGPNGERVFKALNDFDDAVRVVGSPTNVSSSQGQAFYMANTTNDYIEITYYGTGLNLLTVLDANSRVVSVTTDGVADPSVTLSTASNSAVIGGRNYSQNAVVNITSGKTLGIHTTKIAWSSGVNIWVSGYEVINTASSIFLPSAQTYVGGRRLYSASTSTSAYNSGFESGTLGTRGGHVLVYQKADGTIAKAVTPTNTSAAYLASADHTNEEVQRVYHWREFGAGRASPADDFSSLTTSASNRAFTLDDGTTTLVCNQGFVSNSSGGESIGGANTVGSFITFTFVGTGLDIARGAITGNPSQIYIDGVSQGQITKASATRDMQKICSGLPYGTHTVKFDYVSAGASHAQIEQFIVYAPKTPTLPAGAVALADYFVMADFAANSTAGLETIATGVVRKTAFRELVYVNGTGGTADWQISSLSPATQIGGQELNTDRQNAYVEFIFWGIGLDMRFTASSNRSANIQVSLQSVSSGGSLQNLTTTNFPTLASSAYGTGVAFNASTGILDQNDASTTNGVGVRFSGLPLALYKIRFLNNTASSYLVINALDIITPIYAPKEIGPTRLQNVSLIGSSAVRDLRGFAPVQVPATKKVSRAVGIQSGVTTTNTTTNFPCPDLSTVINNTTGRLAISFNAAAFHSALGGEHTYRIFVNGASVSPLYVLNAPAVSYYASMGGYVIVPVPVGTVKVDVYWATNTGTLSQPAGATRSIEVTEI